MWSPTISSDELYHHGILGMRWGRRNGPPYPLDPADHSQSEKKAGYQKSISGSSETSRKKKSIKNHVSEKIKEKTSGLTDEQKEKLKTAGKVALGVGIAVVAGYATYKIAGPEIKELAKAAINKETISEHILKMSTKDLLKAGNLSEKAFSKGRISKANPDRLDVAPKLHEAIAKEANRRLDYNDLVKNPSELAKKVGPLTPYETKMSPVTQFKKKPSTTTGLPSSTKNAESALKTANDILKNNTLNAKNTVKMKQYTNTQTKAASDPSLRKAIEKGFQQAQGSNSDIERLLRTASKLSDLAKNSSNGSKEADSSMDYAQELLKKNKKKFSNMTMKDLSNLDLY